MPAQPKQTRKNNKLTPATRHAQRYGKCVTLPNFSVLQTTADDFEKARGDQEYSEAMEEAMQLYTQTRLNRRSTDGPEPA